MRKVIAILILLLSISSQAQPLVKMIDLVGTTAERHYNFNDEGRLLNISTPAGNHLYEFYYDASGNLTSLTSISASGTVTFTETWTYDPNNIILTHNGQSLSYDAVQNMYFTESVTPEYTALVQWKLTEEGLLRYYYDYFEESDGAVWSDNKTFSFINGNVSAIMTDSSGSWYASYHEYVGNDNPIKTQLMPVLRAASVRSYGWSSSSQPYFMFNHFLSDDLSVLTTQDDGVEGAAHFFEMNSLGKPYKRYYQSYYLGEPEYTGLSTIYYYLGDDIP